MQQLRFDAGVRHRSTLQLFSMAAGAAHRLLLVKHHYSEGYLVHDVAVEDDDKVIPMSRPAVDPLPYRPLAVSSPGDTAADILGFTPPPAAIAAAVAGIRPMGPPPIMLAVGDTTVVRMDAVIYGDHSSRFEMLRRPLAAGGGWCTIPLPAPPLRLPFQSGACASITAYFAMGTSVWISVAGEGTFSLDTQLGTWRMEFPEELRRLEGRAFYAPELGSVVGLTGGGHDRLLCSYRLNGDGVPLTWQHTWSESVPLPSECCKRGYAPVRDVASLAYLGHGKFCVYRPVKIGGVLNFNSYLLLELRRRGDHIEIAKRSAVNYIGMWPQGHYRETYFLQY